MLLARRILPLLAFAVLLAATAVVGARPAQAQTLLVLSDFDQTGVEVELLALITAGETSLWYARGRFGDSGTLVDGDLSIGPNNETLIRIVEEQSGANLLINHGRATEMNFGTYFGQGGAGADLTLHIQLSATEVYSIPVAANLGNAGGAFVNLSPTASGGQTAIFNVAAGARVIIAFTRPSSNTAPVFAEESYSRSVSEEATTGADVGDPITATDTDLSTLRYVLIGTGAADFSVSRSGQITVARALDFETTSSYSLTLTVIDGAGATDTATVVITVTDVDERPFLTPDPAGRRWLVGTRQQFNVADTAGIRSVVVSETDAGRTGDITFGAAEAGTICDAQINSITVNVGIGFWVAFCTAGTLTLRVEDHADPTNFREYTVTVADQVNRAPSFPAATATRSVNENAASGTNAGTAVTATDPDSDPVTYTISGSSLFAIVSETGQIQVASGASVNYEVATNHAVTVTAQDNLLASDTITVTINVVDLDDAPKLTPDPSTLTAHPNSNQQFTVSLPSNAHPTQNVTVTAADGTAAVKLKAAETGLTCSTPLTPLSVAAAGSFYARFCDTGTATLSVAPSNSAVDVREYTVTITNPPTTPEQVTGLIATPGDGIVALEWVAPNSGSSSILHYEYSSDNGATWSTTGSTSVEYTVTQTSAATPANLANGTAYSVRVRAVSAVGAGPESSPANATPRAPSAPRAPSGFTATAGLAQVALSWTAPAVDHDETITDYQYSSDDGASWQSTSSTSTSYTATYTSAAPPANLTLGTGYTFRVRAVNSAGNGAPSASASATPFGLPNAPSNLQGSASGGQVVLNWTAAAANGRTINDYEYSSDNGATWRTTGSVSTSYTATQTSAATPVNLANGTPYVFRVRAVNNVGPGPQSDSTTVTPTTNTAPGQVTGLIAIPGDGFVALEWVAPNNGGAPITNYEYLQDGTGDWKTTGSAATNYTVTSLANGTTYSFQVRARNAVNAGLPSAEQTATPTNQPPAFASDRATRSVDENQVAGTNVGAVIAAADPESNTVTYSITGSNPAGFTVTSSGQLQTGQVLDHEAADAYTITLQAAATGGSDTITVTINVGDVNEAPTFSPSPTSRSIPENSLANTDVGAPVTATDVDSGGALQYTLANGGGRFTIGSGTGQIQVASGADLDYETTQSYQVTVRATDAGGLYAEVSVTINVGDVNDAPVFSPNPTSRSVPENSPAGTDVGGAVTAADPEGGALQYTLANGGGRFTIGSGTGQIQVVSGADLDYETTQSYQVTVRATDAGGLYAEVSVTINVGDVVETPGFSAPSVTLSVAEDAGPGDNVGAAIVATNADPQTLTYSLSGAGADNFEVNGSGQVRVSASASLDHETVSSYSLAIQATNSNGTATAALTINVTNVDELPVFPAATATRTIAETVGSGASVGAPVVATDPERAIINYSLTGAGAASFEVDSLTGQITLAPGIRLDPATTPTYSVTVTARDPGNNTDSILVTINIKDVRDAIAAAEASVGQAYIGTIHLVVGNGGTWYGYQANGYGGLTSGRLPALLFIDHTPRPLELAAIDSSTNQLRLRYSDTETGLLKTGRALEWLRVQVRAADNSILAAGNLWNATGCIARTLCLNVGADISAQNANAVAVDFFDASAEALEASSGGVMSVLLVAEETDTDATGFDDSAGDHIAGHVMGDWMLDGEERDIQQLFVKHGAAGRVVEIHYSAASPAGQWRSDPEEYKRWRLTIRDRTGEQLLQVRLRDALAAMTDAERRCGDARAQRRLCIRYNDDEFDGTNYRGQVVLIQIEDVRGIALIEEVPGGPVGGQIMLTLFGGVMAGWRAKRLRSPVREAVILAFMAFGAMILPFLGIGNLFWAGGILVLAGVAAAAVFFMRAK